MSKREIRQFIEDRLGGDGMVETGVKGVQLFRVSEPLDCAPAVYEPCVVAIVSGTKEVILNGERYEHDSSKYLCCAMPMPMETGTPAATPDNPLLGVYVSLDTKVMTELALKMERSGRPIHRPVGGPVPQGVALASWDKAFTEALLRLLQLGDDRQDRAILGDGRLQELYYALLKGEAGDSARRAFGVGNEIAQAIEFLSSRLDEAVTIEDLAARVGMSRAVFHRKFKQATTMSPIQFVKSMRLNSAAMKIAGGMKVNEAALQVGYVSSSQFSREFRRMFGRSPGQWRLSRKGPE